jgi:tellurite resistance protein TehA-like permease
MLVILAMWRYAVMRIPLRYDPMHWGVVFPLGMYAAATWQMAQVLDLDFLQALAEGFAYLALAAWTATFIGLMTTIGHSTTERGRPQQYPRV